MKNLLWMTLFILTISVMASSGNPKYIFLFIGDGMATPQRMMAEEYATKTGYGELLINHFPCHATTRTCSASSLVTDSAAAGTAIACGEKTNNGCIGMDVGATRKLVSVAEVAHKAGRKVGIISSVTINHATPAAFYAHRAKRSEYYNIGLDLIHSDFEFFGGGGFGGIVDDKSSAEYQGDLYALAEKKGYRVVEGRDALNALTKKDKKVLARGCFGALPYTIDANKEVPTLEEFTVKAIELLDNPNGFFMMIEGGSVDWAGHGNDAATNITEVIALDKTVKRAFDFAKKHPDETLIVVTGDHETGGMTMGFSGTGYALYVERLAHQKASIGQFNLKLIQEQMKNMDMTFEDAKKLLHQYFGFEYTGTSPMLLTKSELELLKQAFEKRKLAETARMIINNKAGIGWTSHAHTALPVLTTSYGQKSELFTGFFDNTDISKKLKSLLK